MAKKRYNAKQAYRASLQNPQNAPADWDDPYLPPPIKLKRRRRWPKVLLSLVLVFAVLGTGAFAAWRLLGDYLDPGVFGIPERNAGYVPKDYGDDIVHFLILGIDYEEGRSYAGGLGLTDMILYARYDLRDNSLNLLQIPRDSYVGADLPTGGTGKINALLASGSEKDNPIQNLTSQIERQFKLPVDHYIALDMDGFKSIVDTLGGLRVYVPQAMDHGGSHLDAGWQWMYGDAAEFFVRNRYGAGFERADIDRLDNQRHFYSALFRRLLNLAPNDIVNLMPVFAHYCKTSFTQNDLIDLAYSALTLSAENVTFCKVPGATGDGIVPAYPGNYYIDLYGDGTAENPGLAKLLNDYFRDAGAPVPADELLLPHLDLSGRTLYPPNVQTMGDVQQPEGGKDVDVEPIPGVGGF